MSTAEGNVQVVRAIYDAFAARDVERVVRHFHPEGEFRPAGTSLASGRAEPYRGVEGMREYFADVAATWDELVLEPHDLRATGDSVIVAGHVRGRGPSVEADADVAWVWEFRDGLVFACRVFPTSGEALRWVESDRALEADDAV